MNKKILISLIVLILLIIGGFFLYQGSYVKETKEEENKGICSLYPKLTDEVIEGAIMLEESEEISIYDGGIKYIDSEFSCEDAIKKNLEQYPGLVTSITLITRELKDSEIIYEESDFSPEDVLEIRFWEMETILTNKYKTDQGEVIKVITRVGLDDGTLLIHKEYLSNL
jgi:hypothetical protein